MKVLIVEDETIAQDYLKNLLKKVEPGTEIVALTEGIFQTVRWLQSNPAPDLIFMDIHLSDGSAFSVFDLVLVETPIIFTTAYDEYAISAFKVNSIDYLLKPVEEADLQKAIGKFRKLTSRQKSDYIGRQAQAAPVNGYYRKILISWRDTLIPLSVEQIAFIYTSDHQTTLYLSDGRAYVYNRTLDSIIQHLDPQQFFRANKQFIVSKEAIANITVWFDRRLLVTLNTETPERIYISKNKATEFKDWIVGGEKS